MTEDQKLCLIGDLLEMNEEELKPDTLLEELENWDSVAVMSLIVMFKKNGFKTILDSEMISQFITIQDILNKME